MVQKTLPTQIGAIPSAAVIAERGALGLTGGKRRNLSERIIGVILLACAALSIATTLGIVAVLIVEAIEFFSRVSFWSYVSGTEWRPNRNVAKGSWQPISTSTSSTPWIYRWPTSPPTAPVCGSST